MRVVSILGVVLAVMSCPLAAQNPPEPLLGIEITPHVGYRTSINFITEPGVDGVNPRVSLDSGPSRGLAVGVRYNDGDVVEFRWSRQDTYMNVVGLVEPPFRQRVTYDQFHMDCSHEYVVDYWPLWARPFIMASVGATRVSSTVGSPSFTRFSFGIGGGVKAFPFRRFGLQIAGGMVTPLGQPGGESLVRLWLRDFPQRQACTSSRSHDKPGVSLLA